MRDDCPNPVRTLPRSLLVSIALHAGLILCLASLSGPTFEAVRARTAGPLYLALERAVPLVSKPPAPLPKQTVPSRLSFSGTRPHPIALEPPRAAISPPEVASVPSLAAPPVWHPAPGPTVDVAAASRSRRAQETGVFGIAVDRLEAKSSPRGPTNALVVEARPVTAAPRSGPVQAGFAVYASDATRAAATALVASNAGFGGVAASSAPTRYRSGAAHSTGFDTAVPPLPALRGVAARSTAPTGFAAVEAAAAKPADPSPAHAPASAIEITFQPRPAYTEEARRRRIEGDVVLEVCFAASGEVQVLRLVRGLGFGLDETAIEAARQVRFVPARGTNGPVDKMAVLRIIFQLAY